MYYRAFFGTITMLGLAALIATFAVLSSPISPPSPAYAETTNNPPEFPPNGDYTRNVAENTAARQNIGNPITATDADNDRLAYTLSGTDAYSFTIVETSGQLRTKAPLNYEARGPATPSPCGSLTEGMTAVMPTRLRTTVSW